MAPDDDAGAGAGSGSPAIAIASGEGVTAESRETDQPTAAPTSTEAAAPDLVIPATSSPPAETAVPVSSSAGTQTASHSMTDAIQQTDAAPSTDTNNTEENNNNNDNNITLKDKDALLQKSPQQVIIRDLDAISESESQLLQQLKAQVEELTGQVTSLNGKLVQSYNRVGGLEDEVERRKHEAADFEKKFIKLEEMRKEWEDKYEGGLLVEKDHVQKELSSMMDRVLEETASRGKAEKERKQIEKEIEQLSQQLFTEANAMVAEERIKRARSERKMEELETNLKDVESLMNAQSTQMKDLGGQVEDLEKEREELRKQIEELQDEALNGSAISLADSSASEMSMHSASTATLADSQAFGMSLPGAGNAFPQAGTSVNSVSSMVAPPTPGGSIRQLAPVSVAHPLQFLAFDIIPFAEFVMFTKAIMRIRKNITTRQAYDHSQAYGSSYASAYGSAYGGAHAPPSYANAGMSAWEQKEAFDRAAPLSQYLNFPFIKRINEEDSDSTLRFSDAPGLTFFSKRNLSSAIIDGNLLIEPAYTSIPSDKCCLCGTSLEKYIASHQSTAPKEDPRKKLTRLATGWIPGTGANSGTATPTGKEQNPVWSISALSDALQGALTPAKEASGFLFGDGSGFGDKNSNLSSSVGPSSANPPPHRRSSSMTGSKPERMNSMSSDTSTGAQSSTSASGGTNGTFMLNASARSNAQIYLFRAIDGDTKYAVCPTFCLPRLRAVCELWNYIRSIQKGLLLEDYPKFASSASRGTENSEYAQHTRKLSMNAQRDTARNVIVGLQTPAMTPGLGTSKQLGALPEDRRPKTSEGVVSAPFGSFGGFTPARSSMDNDSNRPTTSSGLSNSASKPESATNGLGLDIQSRDYAQEPSKPASPESMPAASDTNANASSEDLTNSRRASIEAPGSAGSAQGEFKLTLPPARPKRSTARGGTGTATPTNESATSSPLVSGPSVDAALIRAEQQKQQQGGEKEQADPPSKRKSIDVPAIVTDVASPTASPAPSSATTQQQQLGQGPPPLPARTPSSTSMTSPIAMGPPRLPNRPALGRLTTGQSNLGQSSTTPRSLSRRPSFEAGNSGGAVSTKMPEWQAKCWYEIVRLREAVFWSRVGSTYNQQH